MRYRANTVSNVAVVSGNLDITFSNNVTVSSSLNSNNFIFKNAEGINIPVTPTIYNNKLRLTKGPIQNLAIFGKVFKGQTYSHSSVNDATIETAEQMFDGKTINYSYGWRSGHKYNGTLSGTSDSTDGYSGEWVQVDLGRNIILDNLKVYPYGSRNNEHPVKMRLFSSTNGLSWTQVNDWSGLTLDDDWYPNSVWTPLSVTGLSVTARYFRLVINEVMSGGQYCSLKELELNGHIDSSSFTSTDGTIIYTKTGIASENIISASDSSQAVGSFTIFNGSEDLTGHITDVAGNTLSVFNVLSSDSTAPTISSSSLSGNQFTLVFSEYIRKRHV